MPQSRYGGLRSWSGGGIMHPIVRPSMLNVPDLTTDASCATPRIPLERNQPRAAQARLCNWHPQGAAH